MDYEGIKIYNKVIIVEKQPNNYYASDDDEKTIPQGYVVDVGNQKMLDTALHWSEEYKYDNSLLKGKSYHDLTEEERDAYRNSRAEVEGIKHEYDNGQFEITLDESADNSSQGGKLSFWNCIIKASDGKEYLIGINSELLLHLMMSNTFINGKCQNKIWLGRVKGNQVGAFTENMSEFNQAKEDEKTRQQAKTANKNYAPGDIVTSIVENNIYYGEFKQLFSYYCSNIRLFVFHKNKIKYLYKNNLYDGLDAKNTKVKRIVSGHVEENKTASEYLNDYLTLRLSQAESNNYSADYQHKYQMELLRFIAPNEKERSRKELEEKILEIINYWEVNDPKHFRKLPVKFIDETELPKFLEDNNRKLDTYYEEKIWY